MRIPLLMKGSGILLRYRKFLGTSYNVKMLRKTWLLLCQIQLLQGTGGAVFVKKQTTAADYSIGPVGKRIV